MLQLYNAMSSGIKVFVQQTKQQHTDTYHTLSREHLLKFQYYQAQSSSRFSFAGQTELALFSIIPATHSHTGKFISQLQNPLILQKNDESVKEDLAYGQSFLDGLHKWDSLFQCFSSSANKVSTGPTSVCMFVCFLSVFPVFFLKASTGF